MSTSQSATPTVRTLRNAATLLEDVGCGDYVNPPTAEAMQDAAKELHALEVASLTAEEVHCLVCAMAGNFPEQFTPIRMGLLRKLAKAARAMELDRG